MEKKKKNRHARGAFRLWCEIGRSEYCGEKKRGIGGPRTREKGKKQSPEVADHLGHLRKLCFHLDQQTEYA